jgi:hypothetical protein
MVCTWLIFLAGQRPLQNRLSQGPFLPAGEAKALFHGHAGHAGEMAGHHFLFMIQHVNAQFAVPWNTGFIALLALMHTMTDGGVSVTEHTAVAVMPQQAGVALGGYNVDRSRQAGHGIAKTQTLFI